MNNSVKETLLVYFGEENLENDSSSEDWRKLKFELLKILSETIHFRGIFIEIGAIQSILYQLYNHPEEQLTNNNFVIPALKKLIQDKDFYNIAINFSKNFFKKELHEICPELDHMKVFRKRKNQVSTFYDYSTLNSNKEKSPSSQLD